jgi:cation diffusion facilitator CzcD-associated flavoprotein CzcO
MSEPLHDGKTRVLDAVVIGAGVGGLYQLYQLRELGLKVRAYDAAADVGGTWHWNRYPGAKLDSDSYAYQYLFSEELYKGWSWSSRYASQPEVERWLHYVADKLDLRKDIQFSTTILQANYDESRRRWTLRTDTGELLDARFLISCCGMLSAPMSNLFDGQETFGGRIFHTSRWPTEPVDLAGKRVGVVGIGASGIGVIQAIAETVAELKVFVRNPQYVLPMLNPDYDLDEVEAYKSRFAELQATMPYSTSGFDYDYRHKWSELTNEQRLQVFEDCYQSGSLRLWLASFAEMVTDQEVSDAISEFVRQKMRERLKDPRLCDILIPKDYGFGTVRVPLESGLLEIYRRPNVEPVPVKDNQIAGIVPEGIQLADGTVYGLDVIVLATGFDAGSGSLTRIDIRGREGRRLKEEWSRDIRTLMGLQVNGYPNMFTAGAPLAPSAAFCNVPTCIQQQTEWITGCIKFMQSRNYTEVEASKRAEDDWVAAHDEATANSLIARVNSWYTGSNVPGKQRRVISYTGGVGTYRKLCDEVAANGYRGFEMR